MLLKDYLDAFICIPKIITELELFRAIIDHLHFFVCVLFTNFVYFAILL